MLKHLLCVLAIPLLGRLSDAVDNLKATVPRLLDLLVDDFLRFIEQLAPLIVPDHNVLNAIVNQMVSSHFPCESSLPGLTAILGPYLDAILEQGLNQGQMKHAWYYHKVYRRSLVKEL